jgi:opacity protein-like surface antigen
MKKVSFAALGLAALLAAPAMAADMAKPVYKAPPPLPVIFSWTGCYMGGNVGGLCARAADFFAPRNAPGTNLEARPADSDEVARAFRDDVARCSDMMSPGVRCLAG